MKLRLLLDVDRGHNVFWQMAFDEALLELRSRGEIGDTLRLYIMNPHAVTVGRFQRISEVVDVEAAKSLGVDITRRITGGGTVYHDPLGEITYSIVVKAEGPFEDVEKSFAIICRGVLEAVKLLGAQDARYKPVNDILVSGRKVSGSAQARRRGALLQHGTLMYATRLDVLEKVLAPQIKLLREKGYRGFRDRVTTLSEALHRKFSKEEVVEALVKGFRRALGAELVVDEPSEKELRLVEELEQRYRDPNWIFKRV